MLLWDHLSQTVHPILFTVFLPNFVLPSDRFPNYNEYIMHIVWHYLVMMWIVLPGQSPRWHFFGLPHPLRLKILHGKKQQLSTLQVYFPMKILYDTETFHSKKQISWLMSMFYRETCIKAAWGFYLLLQVSSRLCYGKIARPCKMTIMYHTPAQFCPVSSLNCLCPSPLFQHIMGSTSKFHD